MDSIHLLKTVVSDIADSLVDVDKSRERDGIWMKSAEASSLALKRIVMNS
jgi:hypothetical protein